MSRKKSTLIVILIIAGFTGCISAAALYMNEARKKLLTPRGGEFREIVLDIAKGATVDQICDRLKQEGVLADATGLKLYYRLFLKDKSLKYGEYRFTTEMTPLEMMQDMIAGKVILHRFTVPEGKTIAQIADILKTDNICNKDEFMRIVQSPDSLARYAIQGDSMEGYLFPETYFFSRSVTAEQIVDTMVQKSLNVLREYESQAKELGLSSHRLMTLASMIEKESSQSSERTLISAVFHNRLKKNMLMQCDPTVIYAMGDAYNGRIRKADLKIDSPYNTYVYPGLPPGPIACPGKAAIDAAANPAPVDYLYFVSRNDGTHHFSRTHREHQQAVWKYQKQRKSR